ncbi:CCAAT-displacement protein alternatively spliced product [Klebsormidium nitens]|uniref:CCAAT-displacement protein alternatively spliced product n=1 Tax=Klebsormidium nitens TaxID=105231 RepID=A0A1Y1I725_KLENI|nr:CCAAT-displacement protein alternatively spliced product [Klebsormidium nitens]|eukprot:GAQ83908.1 CCAAT-displacement protein alternatively spliced product [Klebsormidium nitens]
MRHKVTHHFWLLDGVRIAAFIWTVALHTEAMLFLAAPADQVEGHYNRSAKMFWHRLLFWQGHFALDIFMLLSGFLFSASCSPSEKGSLWIGVSSCLVRRLRRLAPLYYLVLTVHLLTPAPRKENAWRAFLFLSNTVSVEQQYLPHTWSVSLDVQATIALYLLHRWAASTPTRRSGAETAPECRRVTARLASAAIIFTLYGVGMSSWLVYGEQRFRLPLKVLGHEAFRNSGVDLSSAYQTFYEIVYLSLPVRLPAYLVGSVLWHMKYGRGISTAVPEPHKLGLSFLATALWYSCLALPFSSSAGLADYSAITSVGVAAVARPAAALATAILLYAWLPNKQKLPEPHQQPLEGSLRSEALERVERLGVCQVESIESVGGGAKELKTRFEAKWSVEALDSSTQMVLITHSE